VLAGAGVAVTVYDAMPSVGRKLLVAGRSGLNLTHSEPTPDLLARYGDARGRLEPAIVAFDANALRAWCEGLGEATFVGSSGRVFPERLRATPLLRAWLRRLSELGVELRARHRWVGWDGAGRLAFEVGSPVERTLVTADAVVLALGGASWPRTGSDGRWVDAVESAGIAVAPLRPANCGVTVGWSAVFRERFAGTPVKDVVVRHAAAEARGDLVVTESGLEGGPVYALSAAMRPALDAGPPVVLEVDVYPDRAATDVVARLDRRRPKDSVASGLDRAGVAPVVVGLVREATGNRPPREARELAVLLKALPIDVTGTQPIARAISTAGGVSMDEVDERYMLRARPGTFVAGEMLDWEAPTGGYLLQATFSTAVAAAVGTIEWLGGRP
jgi:uncharacterized flavoprotein (TIGR03862 family)